MNKLFLFGIVILITVGICAISLQQVPSADAATSRGAGVTERAAQVPVAISGNNIYVAWWTNKSGNDEVIFRSSNDAAKTFSDKINLSNSTNAESQDVEISADGSKVVITWWERNQTASEPVMKMSTDGGKTFGPLLKLSINGTLGTEETKPEP